MAEQHSSLTDAVTNPDVHHEESDVNLRGILMFALGLFAVAVAIHILVWGIFRYFESREARHQPQVAYPLALDRDKPLPPEPRLQTNPREDLRLLRASEDEALTTYGWVDRNAGIVRIPIDEAMKLMLQRGLPARQGSTK